MDYFVKGRDGEPIEARVSVENGRIVLHSRSGRSPTNPRGRNPGYVAAFDAIFDRLNVPDVVIDRVLLDSTPSHGVPEDERTLATRSDFTLGVLSQVKNQMRAKMRNFGRTAGMPQNEGNQNKKIRIDTSLGDSEINRRLRVVVAGTQAATGTPAHNTSREAAATEFLVDADTQKVQPAHVARALTRLDAGEAANGFSPTAYEAMTADGKRYAPPAVFAFALEEALGIKVGTDQFSTGWGTPCFNILEQSGLWIVPKANGVPRGTRPPAIVGPGGSNLLPGDEETAWIEGNPRIVVHLSKERQSGLAKKKRTRFVEEHGKLFCERCHLDPVEQYGEGAGDACIEVHHHRTHVSDMQPGHETSLDDLKCLCSNCHRVLHRALTLGVPFNL